jgi:hypothetical protein
MKIKGLDGRDYSWSISQYRKTRQGASAGHKRARQLLRELFPCEIILEELTLVGTGRYPLYADFFLSGPKLMVEVNGQQHYKYDTYHYANKTAWNKARNNDARKQAWCELNDITLVVLDDKNTEEFWKKQIDELSN